ncbi:MAG: Serine-type D-Ala-D-Ala carboxypeptidase [Verrucomicrobiales bacterium]|nr:Serine-type D-Ala-D-Ala carboxypeptidase [Verrucomicrobiales bacterium]
MPKFSYLLKSLRAMVFVAGLFPAVACCAPDLGGADPLAVTAGSKSKKAASAPAKPMPKKVAVPAKPAPAAKPAKPATLAREPYLGAIVVDADSGQTVFEDRADAQGYPASVLKLMLLLTAMEQIRDGRLTLQDEVPVSARAVLNEGADLQLKEDEVFTAEDMLYALMIHSANDAAVAMAEKLGGSVEGYLAHINRRAQELGMKNSHFVSPSGLGPANPGEPHDLTTPRDLSLLCMEILKHPEALRFTSARDRIFRPDGGARRVKMETHNYILDSVKGCDGLKTGYIRAAGYCIAGTAKRGDRRLVVVILGATSETSRNKWAGKLLDKGFITVP